MNNKILPVTHEIREYLKKLSNEDIANSVYLVGIDFDNCALDIIINSIIQLLNEVISLKNIYDSFKEEPKVLSPIPKISHNPKESPQYRQAISEEYFRKSSALTKIVSNNYIYEEVFRKMTLPEEEGMKL